MPHTPASTGSARNQLKAQIRNLGLTTGKQYLLTLNRPSAYDDKQVISRMVYHHPTYTNASMATQASLPTLNGVRNTWFCGSYFGYGFHEDAVRSSYQMAAQLQKLSN